MFVKEKNKMSYVYELLINGTIQKVYENQFKPNIIAEIAKDLDQIDSKMREISFRVMKKKRN